MNISFQFGFMPEQSVDYRRVSLLIQALVDAMSFICLSTENTIRRHHHYQLAVVTSLLDFLSFSFFCSPSHMCRVEKDTHRYRKRMQYAYCTDDRRAECLSVCVNKKNWRTTANPTTDVGEKPTARSRVMSTTSIM